MSARPRVSTGMLVGLGAILLGSGTGVFLLLSLLPTRHPVSVVLALVVSFLGYWFVTRAYFILEDRHQRAMAVYDDSGLGVYVILDRMTEILREEG